MADEEVKPTPPAVAEINKKIAELVKSANSQDLVSILTDERSLAVARHNNQNQQNARRQPGSTPEN